VRVFNGVGLGRERFGGIVIEENGKILESLKLRIWL
jgi:hypothetical protein